MAKFKVTYEHEVVITYEAIVEADSEQEARAKLEEDMDFISEEEIDHQGVSVTVTDVEEYDEEE
jgi:thioester reductase-like protein